MNEISSFGFIKFKEKLRYQSSIDSFFLLNEERDRILDIKSGNSNSSIFKINSLIGEIRFTILGSNEKDFNFYGDILREDKVEKLVTWMLDMGVDNIKIPLLSKDGAIALKNIIGGKMKNFIFEVNLDSVTPIIDKKLFSKSIHSYTRQIKKFEDQGGEFKRVRVFDESIKELHVTRWGKNRSDDFFNYLTYMNECHISESFGLFLDNKIIAYIQMIPTGDMIHYYYSIFDGKYKGSGSAILGYVIKAFINNKNLRFFSFGRGSERYKHRWSTGVIKNFELRGFLI